MADVHNKTRSYNMSMVRSRETQPEITVRKFLFVNGFRYKLHDKKLVRRQALTGNWQAIYRVINPTIMARDNKTKHLFMINGLYVE